MFHCIGCGHKINWDGKGYFSYTCPCGGHCFVSDDTGFLSLPSSVVRGIANGQALPHLDDIVGVAEYSSAEKDSVIAELRSKGFVWMEECEQCQADGTLERTQRRRQWKQAHEQIYASVRVGELTLEEAMKEHRRVDKAG